MDFETTSEFSSFSATFSDFSQAVVKAKTKARRSKFDLFIAFRFRTSKIDF
jgi:hypothetical protein